MADNADGGVILADAYAVITPDGNLHWYPLAGAADVEAMVGGTVAPGALDTVTVAGARIPGRGPLKCLASDIALLFPGDYPPNPLAGAVLRELSGGRISQNWRGTVALVEYQADPRTGEVLWPGGMSPRWAEMVDRAVRRARDDIKTTGEDREPCEDHDGSLRACCGTRQLGPHAEDCRLSATMQAGMLDHERMYSHETEVRDG